MSKTRKLHKNFSVRVGLLSFVVFSITLLSVRYFTYQQAINTSYHYMELIINAHVAEINEGMDRYGEGHVESVVRNLADDVWDPDLYLAFVDRNGEVAGNIQNWPEEVPKKAGIYEITIDYGAGAEQLHMLTKVIPYPKGGALLVGYDMQRVDELQSALKRGIVLYLAASLALALCFSLLLIWLLNRYLMKLNRACERVISGDLSYSIPVFGNIDQFDRLSSNFNRMLRWIEVLIGTVRDSSNAIAHDMRTPLSRHRLRLRSMLTDGGMSEKEKEKIKEAVAEVDGLVDMFDNILSIASAEGRASVELYEDLDLAEVVGDLLEFYGSLFEEKGIKATASAPEGKALVRGDRQLITQAVANLIDNAAKYCPENGNITVSVFREDGHWHLSVADDGEGVPDEYLEKIQERFFRLDKSRTTKGSGLGLSLVRAVASLHQGRLILENLKPGFKATLIIPASKG